MQSPRPYNAMNRTPATVDGQAFSLAASLTLPWPPQAAPAPRRGAAASPPPPRPLGRTPNDSSGAGVRGGASGGGLDDGTGAVGPSGSTRVLTTESSVQFEGIFPVEESDGRESDANCHSDDSENSLDFENCQPPRPPRRDRWRGLKQDTAGFLDASRLQREAVEGCGTIYTVWLHKKCGARVGTLWTCKNRWCPDCFRAWAGAAVEELRAELAGFKAPKHLVLSIRAAGLGELRAGWKLLDKGFRNLRRSKLWKGKARGWVQARGLTFSRGRWHVHIHVAVDADYMPHLELKAAWVKASGGAGGPAGVQINAARDLRGLAVELVKGTKGDFKRLRQQLKWRPVLWGELVLGCRGLRWYSPGGKRPPKREERPPCCCPRCGDEFNIHAWDSSRATAEEYAEATLGPCWKDYFDGFARGSPVEMGAD